MVTRKGRTHFIDDGFHVAIALALVRTLVGTKGYSTGRMCSAPMESGHP